MLLQPIHTPILVDRGWLLGMLWLINVNKWGKHALPENTDHTLLRQLYKVTQTDQTLSPLLLCFSWLQNVGSKPACQLSQSNWTDRGKRASKPLLLQRAGAWLAELGRPRAAVALCDSVVLWSTRRSCRRRIVGKRLPESLTQPGLQLGKVGGRASDGGDVASSSAVVFVR